jgi:glycosyltransferase involved in cell wall biosynthesis
MTAAASVTPWPGSCYILIPAYQAAQGLQALLPALAQTIPADRILVGDDASGDESVRICSRYGVGSFSLLVNQGKGAVLRRGFDLLRQRGAQWILTMDADGQHSVDDIPAFIEASRRFPDAAMIIGSRRMRPGTMPLARICSNGLTSGLVSVLTGRRIRDSQCGFRLYSARFLAAITIRYPRFEMETEVILKACHQRFPIHFIPVQTLYCSTQSHISHLRDTLRWIRAVGQVWLAMRKENAQGH